MVHQQPPNWVAERAKCRIDIIFDALSQVVKRDVAEFNNLVPSLRHQRTAVVRNGDGTHPMIRVCRAEADGSESTLTFTQEKTHIAVLAPDYNQMLRPDWVGNPPSCLLLDRRTDAQYKVWEVSRDALGFFLFG